jgi:hypothetical protein
MDTIDIKIEGAGRTFTAELILITRYLESLGYDVTVKDDYPFEGSEEVLQEYLEKIVKSRNKSKIVIETEHHPWGG